MSERIIFSCSSGSSPSFYFTFLPTRYVCTYPRVCPSARNEKQVATSAAFVGAISPLLTLLPACTTRVSEGEELESSERIFFSCSSSSSPSFYLKILPTRYVWDGRNSGHFHHIFPDQSLEQRKNCAFLQKKLALQNSPVDKKLGGSTFVSTFKAGPPCPTTTCFLGGSIFDRSTFILSSIRIGNDEGANCFHLVVDLCRRSTQAIMDPPKQIDPPH